MGNGMPERRSSNIIPPAIARRMTRRVVFIITALVIIPTIVFLIWSLRPIILPFIIGTFAAFLCFPLLKFFTRIGLPRPGGIVILFGTFFLVIFVIVNQLGSLIPDERDQLILRTRFQFKMNERYKSFMGIGTPEETGNMLYKYFGKDFDKFMDSVNTALRLKDDERILFMKYRYGYKNMPVIQEQYYNYFIENLGQAQIDDAEKAMQQKNKDPDKDPKEKKEDDTPQESNISVVMGAIKLWIIMPLVFLFLLIDDGEIKRFFIGLVPNRYFEVSLAVVNKVTTAIGNYLRSILIECLLVAAVYIVMLILVGFEIPIAIMIGLFAGLANAIPLLGPGIALIIGSAYALIAENTHSILPFITSNNLIIAVAGIVLLVMVIDNTVFQPFVVGGAVQLHPLVVFMGIIGGSMLFGFAGLILAIPTIVVVKEFFSTLFRDLKEYYII